MTQTLELQAWTLKNKKIMINVLQALMKKVDNIQDQIGNFRDIETTNQWEMLKIKNIVTDMKNALGLAIHWPQPRKESVSLKTCQ